MTAAKELYEEKVGKTINVLKTELNTVRAGRANAAILDQVRVDYYGTPTPLKSLANISVPDPRTLLITPFDPQSVGDIERAIHISNLGINPSNDGKNIRLVIPQLTEERRRELTKVIKGMGEDSKVAVRNCRREANDEIRRQEKDKELTEDEMHSALDEIQKLTDDYMKEIDSIIEDKEKELMEV